MPDDKISLVSSSLLSIYKGATALLAPVVSYWVQKKASVSYGDSGTQLLGKVPKIDYKNPVWFHTVSVGESQGAKPLILDFHKQYPEIPILVTTTTATGKEVYKNLDNVLCHLFAPLDSPLAVKRFLDATKPRLYVTMETELWPVLLQELNKRNIPVIVMNARLSDHSCKNYHYLGKVFKDLIGNRAARFICQTQGDCNNFKKLGVSDDQLSVSGSIKFDIMPDSEGIEKGRKWRSNIEACSSKDRKFVLTVASTHQGEDEIILNCFTKLKQRFPELVMVLIPRHPERFSDVAKLLEASGFKVIRRSTSTDLTNDGSLPDIILGDSMGETTSYFTMSDLVFMGGSLVDIGGHNPLEPASLDIPAVTGPYIRNFLKIYRNMEEQSATLVIPQENLEEKLAMLISDANLLKTMVTNSHKFMEMNRGAKERTLKEISNFLK